VIAVAGWLWSDRVTRNVHRLGGRLPTRSRCISAWAVPVVVAAALAFTVVRLEPAELVDVRPMIIVPLLALTVWRPYSLVRRIVSTLSRVRSDALIGIAYLLELAGFGLMWWQLATWPDELTPGDVGPADVMIGVGSAAAIAFGLSIVVWILLLRDVSLAQSHRVLAMSTQHDHRQLRLRGINPMDPEVRWALLRIRQEQAEATASAGSAPPAPVVSPSPTVTTIRTVTTATDSGEVPASPSVAGLLGKDDADRIIADLVEGLAAAGTSARMLSDLADEMASETETGSEFARAVETRQTPPSTGWDPNRSLLDRLGDFGITPGSSSPVAIPDVPPEMPVERMIPPKLYLLEAVRHLFLVGIATVAATAALIVTRVVSVGTALVDGVIAPTDVDRIEDARWAFVTALALTFALVPIWCGVVITHARRAGMTGLRAWPSYALAAAALALNVIALVVDGRQRGDLTLACTAGCLVFTLVAIATLLPIGRQFDLGTRALAVWSGGLVAMFVLSWVGGLQRPIQPADSLQLLTFVGALETVVAGLALVVGALNSGDLEDSIRLAPALARRPR
jgi:hypothetical protein